MASATRVRDWATVDYYALLGVEPTAGADAVTRAFRELAKRSHPDATDDAAAAERFSDVTAAYAVLGDERIRREYDQVRAAHRGQVSAGTPRVVPVPAAGVRKPWTRRRAWTVLVSGVLVTLLGVGAAWLTWSMHAHDARQRSRFVPVTAARVDVGGSSIVSFLTRTGQRVRVPEPQQHGDPNGLGPTVKIRYDPANPEHVIVDSSTAGRDITFSIVALKLLIGGPVFTVLGWRRRHGATRMTPTAVADCLPCTNTAAADQPVRERILHTEHWRVAHAFNTAQPGWLVVLPTKHVTAIAELDEEAAATLGSLLRDLSVALREVVGCVKTYVIQLAEAEGFSHVHFHVVPRMADQPEDMRGPRVFGLLGVPPGECVTEEEMDRIGTEIRARLG